MLLIAIFMKKKKHTGTATSVQNTELRDIILLQELSNSLVEDGRVEQLYEQILRTSLTIMEADAASMQLYDAEKQVLELLTWDGADSDSTKFRTWIEAGRARVCKIALADKKRILVTDVQQAAFLERTEDLDYYSLSGIQAVQATPLIARNGNVVGIISSHWKHSYTPTDRQLALLDVIARQAADLMERDLSVTFRDTEDRKRADAGLSGSVARLAAAFESVPVGVAVISISGEIIFGNAEYRRFVPVGRIPSLSRANLMHWQAWDVNGRPLESQDFPVARALRGETVVPGQEMLYIDDAGREIWTSIASVPTLDQDGRVTGAVSVISDIDALKRNTEALRESEERFRTLTQTSPLGVGVSSTEGKIIYSNRALEAILGYEPGELLEQPSTSVYYDVIERLAWLKAMKKTGMGSSCEIRFKRKDNSPVWVAINVAPIEYGGRRAIIGIVQDIDEHKQAEIALQEAELQYRTRLEQDVRDRTAELQQSRDQLQSILDTTLVQLSILEAVRNVNGEITDLKIIAVNQELEKETGRTDLVGRLYAAEYPGIRKTGLFDMIVKAIETNEPQTMEYFYSHEGFQKWFSCMFVKLDDGVVATNLDITARKTAEEDRFKNYLLLQQSEDLAALGSWDYDLLTKSFTWSDGMYRLFDLEKGKEIKPEIYLEYSTKNGLAAAKRLVQHIRNGDSDFEETLEINVSGKIKILRLKGAVVINNEGRAERVLGVDVDISAMRMAEDKIRQMEAEQKLEIFRVSLSTLEEERHRIAESLHNGIGQILYGIKINMESLRYGMDESDFNANKAYTDKLLKDTIIETRRISHELMPTTLERFGLQSAIDGVCKQLSDGTEFECKIIGSRQRMEKYLELAIYRTAQELMTNVVKHANATKCYVVIHITREEINIQVSDNGQGITVNSLHKPGIGLASIRSKIKLLNGEIDINSAPAKGTNVQVAIPRPDNKNPYKEST